MQINKFLTMVNLASYLRFDYWVKDKLSLRSYKKTRLYLTYRKEVMSSVLAVES